MSDNRVFIIAECGSSWRFGADHLANAYRMIEAAKECGADAVKFQWTSDYKLMMARRGAPLDQEGAYQYVEYDGELLALLKAHADKVGIEWMCTVFLPQDVSVIASVVKRFKVAAKESRDVELIKVLLPYRMPLIISERSDEVAFKDYDLWSRLDSAHVDYLHCVSKYPCPIEEIALRHVGSRRGLSDHTGHVLTGAVAVGAGATTLEVHFKLDDTPSENCDFPHSHFPASLREYIGNVRVASRML